MLALFVLYRLCCNQMHFCAHFRPQLLFIHFEDDWPHKSELFDFCFNVTLLATIFRTKSSPALAKFFFSSHILRHSPIAMSPAYIKRCQQKRFQQPLASENKSVRSRSFARVVFVLFARLQAGAPLQIEGARSHSEY